MELINFLIDNYNIPILSAFLLGLLSSISPCTMVANIGAVAYIAKDLDSPKKALFNGLFYTVGRGLSYALLGVLIYFGVSTFSISNIFQGRGSLLLGPIFISLSLIMLGIFKLNFNFNNQKFEQIKKWLVTKGYLGSLLLGMLLALAFCPYSGVLFFGVLVPLTIQTTEGLLLFFMFALGTGLLVVIFALVIAFGINKIGKVFEFLQNIEKYSRKVVSIIFLVAGMYYSKFLIE